MADHSASVTRHVRRANVLLLLLAVSACGNTAPSPETVFIDSPPTWFEDGWTFADIAPDAKHALWGARFGLRLIDLATAREDTASLRSVLDQVTGAVFDPRGGLVRHGSRGVERGWFAEGDGGGRRLELPVDAVPTWSPKGELVAWSTGSMGTGQGLWIGTPDRARRIDLPGTVTGIAWAPDARTTYATTWDTGGRTAIYRIDAGSGAVDTVRTGLDALWRFNRFAVSPDGETLFLSLVSADVPDPAARHDPAADRDTDIWSLDLKSRALRAITTEPGDDFAPDVVGDMLYWTHNELRNDVAVVALTGGTARVVVPNAQIPYWHPKGNAIAFTVGDWRIVDWALNLDAAVIEVDSAVNPVGQPRPIVTGYHEDFTPNWSPNGAWIAYHSHRSATAVHWYSDAGSTDDLWLRRPDAPMKGEIRLTDFAWEIGPADWSPDGTRLVFDSWERGGQPGIARPWIATIDTATGRAIRMERLRIPEGFGGTLFGAWSPKRDEIALVERIDAKRQALWILTADGASAKRLIEFGGLTYGGVDWTPDGESLVYAALPADAAAPRIMQLFAIPRSGGVPRQISRGAQNLIHPQVSPNGRWVAATSIAHRKEIRRLPIR